jgi:protein-tyrosine kinase
VEIEPSFPGEQEPETVPPADVFVPAPEEGHVEVLRPVADLSRLSIAEKLSPTSRYPGSVEQYRRLAARLHLIQSEQRTAIVMVTSALPGEGKTLTAANVALTLSESYRRKVLLVDADLRRPWMHQLFEVPNLRGLSEGLRSDVERKVPLIELTEHLTLLTAGAPEHDPMSVLSSDRMRRILEEAATKFQWVIIDTPPVGLLTDAHLLAELVDTVLLVVHAGRTPVAAVKTTIQALGRERILGVVLNRSEAGPPESSYYYANYRVSA